MFKHVKDNKYILDNEYLQVIEMNITRIINDISKDDIKYNIGMNEELYNTILNRFISNKFLETNKDIIKDGQYIVIDITIHNKSFMITIGNVNSEYLYGMSEK